ncbi:uncharacterized protein BYT42DRAFT_40822 [Radiomyces spectabilis]|uniref:uncharacterized protein n=1 Tax=Radiomyces spectabilis TaxID=64574 RepID=UPI0022206238|nr:uncharacterized protein BYT42DRAFT_40822 [Radiomyces spectabilis]KAI8394329.1 hypothetical protein BYT42DRAFT_40822 [Radiomyces spectabilis]
MQEATIHIHSDDELTRSLLFIFLENGRVAMLLQEHLIFASFFARVVSIRFAFLLSAVRISGRITAPFVSLFVWLVFRCLIFGCMHVSWQGVNPAASNRGNANLVFSSLMT